MRKFLAHPICLSLIAIIGSFQAHPAFAWEPIFSCSYTSDETPGGIVVDTETFRDRAGTGVRTQLVIRDPGAVQWLMSQGAFDSSSLNERGEIITSDILQRPGHLAGPIFMGTAKRFSAEEYEKYGYAFQLYEIWDLGNGSYRLSVIKANPYPTARPEVANWVFRGCWIK
jgi:hypothetical protein